MSSATIDTLVKMLESLTESMQKQVLEHLREYVEDLRDEQQWDEAFSRSQDRLAAAAQRARKDISEGKAQSLNDEDL